MLFGNLKEFLMVITKQTLRTLLADESGQDLIEYALVAALIALGAVAAMNNVAVGISNAFSAISSDLTSAVA
jgi:pilus assembly protein Flp/PilA